MKRIVKLFFVVLLVVIVFGYSPLESTAITLNESEEANAVIMADQKESTETNVEKAIDEKMIIRPNFNCDPGILITDVPDIDPHFLLKDFHK